MNLRFAHSKEKKPIQKNNMHTEHSEQPSKEGEHESTAPDLELSDEPTPDMSVANSHESLKELIEKNIKWSQVVYNQNKGIKRRLTMMVLGSYIRLFLILTPIVLGIIYLPPFVADLQNKFESAIGDASGSATISELLQQFIGSEQKDATQGRK